MNNTTIAEALKIMPLTDEEKSAKHILARLYGPIATCLESTRNGRHYNKDLWKKALTDELMQEKIKNKCLFLELGHPTDREEIDMTKVCACIPELPKIINDDLYAYVDILDTPNGRILKTLCDYGFTPGISSRGSGDVDYNNEVDPETFYLETFDIVNIPAVKKARLAMCESLQNNKTLKQALTESLKVAEDKDKEIMQEALNNLDIKLTEDINEVDTDIAEEEDSVALEAEESTEEAIEDSEVIEDSVEADDSIEETNTSDKLTINAFIDQFKDYDGEREINFAPIVIDENTYYINSFNIDDTDGIITINIEVNSDASNQNEDELEIIEDEEVVDDNTAIEDTEEVTEDDQEEAKEEEASDAGTDELDELMESLKRVIREKDLLEKEVKTLKANAVSDAEVKALKEDLDKYKAAFLRTNEINLANNRKVKELESEKVELTEQLNHKNVELNKLKQARQENSNSLTESLKAEKSRTTVLEEQLKAKDAKLAESEANLDRQVNAYKKKLNESVNIAKAYKQRCTEAIDKYISFRASMLGVKKAEIVNRLNENYTIDEVDNVCDRILTEGDTMSRLPYGITQNSRVKIKAEEPKKANPYNGYDIDDDLLRLAGLKD